MIYATNSTPAGPVAFALTLVAGCIQGRFKVAGKDRPLNQCTSNQRHKTAVISAAIHHSYPSSSLHWSLCNTHAKLALLCDHVPLSIRGQRA